MQNTISKKEHKILQSIDARAKMLLRSKQPAEKDLIEFIDYAAENAVLDFNALTYLAEYVGHKSLNRGLIAADRALRQSAKFGLGNIKYNQYVNSVRKSKRRH